MLYIWLETQSTLFLLFNYFYLIYQSTTNLFHKEVDISNI